MESSISRRFVAAVILLSAYQRIVHGNYQVQVALVKWENPQGATMDNVCCEDHSRSPPTCHLLSNPCETYFQVCLQPHSYSASNRNCPYSSFSSNYDSTQRDSDNITFTFGVGLPGGMPNPMTFTIRDDTIDAGLRVIVTVYDHDVTSSDDLIDEMRFNILNPVLSNSYTNLSVTNQIGNTIYTKTMNISYRITCMTGFTGTDCKQSTVNNNSSGCEHSPVSTTDSSATDSSATDSSATDNRDYADLLSLLILSIILTVTLSVSIIVLMIAIYKKSRSSDNYQFSSDNRNTASYPVQPPPPTFQVLPPPSPAVSVNSIYRDSFLASTNGPGNNSTLSIHNTEDGRSSSRQSKASLFADDYENKLNSNPAYATSPTFNKEDDDGYI